jgi:hypothetical protein
MTDHKNPMVLPTKGQIIKEASHPLNRLVPTLPTGIGLINEPATIPMNLGGGGTIERPVIALPQSPIEQYGELGSGERDLDGLSGATEIGAEYRS